MTPCYPTTESIKTELAKSSHCFYILVYKILSILNHNLHKNVLLYYMQVFARRRFAKSVGGSAFDAKFFFCSPNLSLF